jgi:hypothetical protein
MERIASASGWRRRCSRKQSSGVPTFPTRCVVPSVGRVPSYFVETYLSRGDARWRPSRELRARAAVQHLTKLGIDVHFNHTIHVPEDEICFFVFEAESATHAGLAATQAGLEPLRIVEAIASGKESV